MGAKKLQVGFGNHFESEAIPNVLPIGQNSPQHVEHGLYAEQISGTAFTAPRATNQRSWMYRIRPSVCHTPFEPFFFKETESNDLFKDATSTPEQLRWSPIDPNEVETTTDWLTGLLPIACSGDPSSHHGLAIYTYAFRATMGCKAFYSSDGDFLIVPQEGALLVTTEFGLLEVFPREICVVQRGIRFKIDPLPLKDQNEDSNADKLSKPSYEQLSEKHLSSDLKMKHSHIFTGKDEGNPCLSKVYSGYVLEVYNGHFELPELSVIGANGLANPQDFEYPTAHFFKDDESSQWILYNKFNGCLFACSLLGTSTPFDVVAWRGNYVPFKYSLDRFVAIGSVTRDHPDPSIFTVLTCKSSTPGTAIADFVIFPPRWQVAQETFRPPYFHRNVMSEYMGMICGRYEAKTGDGFVPGGASLHPNCTPHGPDAGSYQNAISEPTPQQPVRVGEGSLAFMFETSLVLKVTASARKRAQLEYNSVWASIPPARI